MAFALRKTLHPRGAMVLTAEGGVSLHTSGRLRELIERAVYELDKTPNLIVDFTGVDFCDSAGLAVLVSAFKRVTHRSGTFTLVCPPGPVLRLLHISGLHTVFPIHARLDQAVEGRMATGP